ncbi:threonine ammonia-lyase [Pseudonocardia alni]|uniref:threonine ammonia-lyase n=1 Tax=Pseudonocardia alni TaxID=33907 RepID=UPI00280B1DEF|nr:threonine ammonia-lyase [Pseudonocardia alni]
MRDAADDYSLAALRDARELLAGVIESTPVAETRWLSGVVGTPVRLKCENLQRTGSFKIRGAYVRIARLNRAEQQRGVVAASAGNHAQGVALSSSLLGLRATVFMPESVAAPKEQATRAYGAEVHLGGVTVEEAITAATEFAERSGAVFVHPFDHPDIVAGQASVGLEILDQVPEVSTIVVPVGGGGLAAGVAEAVRAARPDVRVVGVQAERVAPYPPSLAVGRVSPVEPGHTMADGIAVARPGHVPFRSVRRGVDHVLTVSEAQLGQSLLLLLERTKLLVEPAGAAAVAALIARPEVFAGDRCVVPILSGGNIDPGVLLRVARHGMTSAGRYLSLRGRIADRPGEMARLLATLARLRLNLLDIAHERTASALDVNEVQVAVQVETRGLEHRHEILTGLLEAGYDFGEGRSRR